MVFRNRDQPHAVAKIEAVTSSLQGAPLTQLHNPPPSHSSISLTERHIILMNGQRHCVDSTPAHLHIKTAAIAL